MWLILCLNCACFVVVTMCYTIINTLNTRSSERSGASQSQSNRAIQNRITAMIATDFLCWVPFTIICALHNLQVIDATYWYVHFTMVVLPINSVINPILYDNTLRQFLSRNFQRMSTVIGNSSIAVYVRQIGQERGSNRTEDNIEMEPVKIPATRCQGDGIVQAEED